MLFDPAATRVVRSSELHMHTDYTPYEGRADTGWPRTVLARGRVVVRDGTPTDPGPVGRFLSADPIDRSGRPVWRPLRVLHQRRAGVQQVEPATLRVLL